ncbi:MAG: DUF2520 domain-containing protein, partial [Sphingobacteriales bacterium]
PAKRGDAITIERHLEQLQEPELQEIYKMLSKSIKKMHS